MADKAQRHTPDSANHDSIDARVTPIVVVPGVMGTRLATIGGGPNWDPDTWSEMLKWITLSQRTTADLLSADRAVGIIFDLPADAQAALAANPAFGVLAARSLKANTSSTTSQVYAERGWGEVAWGFYGNLLTQLELRLNRGAGTLRSPVYAVGYDWRESCRVGARRLRGRIQRILADHPLAENVIVITHSMGGLVTRAALRDGATPLIAGVIHCVQPANGAPVAYRRFQTGAVSFFDNVPYAAKGAILTDIMGTSRIGYAVTQSRLRGPVELLPNNEYPEIFLRMADGTTNRDANDIYAVYLRDTAPGVMVREREFDVGEAVQVAAADVASLSASLNQARRFHSFMTQPQSSTAHSETSVLFGDGLVTDVEFDWNLGQVGIRLNQGSLLSPEQRAFESDMRLKAVRLPRGDGTVPTASSRFTNANPAPFMSESFAVDHAACFGNADLIARIEVLTRGMSGNP